MLEDWQKKHITNKWLTELLIVYSDRWSPLSGFQQDKVDEIRSKFELLGEEGRLKTQARFMIQLLERFKQQDPKQQNPVVTTIQLWQGVLDGVEPWENTNLSQWVKLHCSSMKEEPVVASFAMAPLIEGLTNYSVAAFASCVVNRMCARRGAIKVPGIGTGSSWAIWCEEWDSVIDVLLSLVNEELKQTSHGNND